MPELHINDELLDQYSSGTLSEEHWAGVEEHLLTCESCQSRLEESDEFAMLFRAAAVEPDVRSQPSWRRFWNNRSTSWTLAAAAALAVLLLVAGPFRSRPTAPATVVLQSLRGPAAPAQIAAGRSVLLVFDIVPTAGADEYEARVVNPVGIEILTVAASVKDGRLAARVDRLPTGSYWVRVFRTNDREPIAEYGLRVR